MNYTDDERLAIAVALDKQIHPLAADLKAENKFRMQTAYEESGVTQRALKIGDIEVGKTAYTPTKETVAILPGHEKEAYEILQELGLLETRPVSGWQNAFICHEGKIFVEESGEEVSEFFYQSLKASYSSVRGCEIEKVTEALAKRGLGAADAVAGLLEGK